MSYIFANSFDPLITVKETTEMFVVDLISFISWKGYIHEIKNPTKI